jgi:hypothetical protein
MKIRTVAADLFRADRPIDMKKLKVPFRNFANAPKKQDTQFPASDLLRIMCLLNEEQSHSALRAERKVQFSSTIAPFPQFFYRPVFKKRTKHFTKALFSTSDERTRNTHWGWSHRKLFLVTSDPTCTYTDTRVYS